MRPIIENQTAIVTGAANGIGEAIAFRLADEGYKVAVLDRDYEGVQRVALKINELSGDATAIEVNVADSHSVNSAMSTAYQRLNDVHVLVNCAGFSMDSPITTMTDEEWGKVINVCLTGAFYCCRAVSRHMLESRYGRIINISSRALNGDVSKANYSSAKAGLIGLTKALSLELGSAGITVNAVAPGIIDTERLRTHPRFKEIEKKSKDNMPIKRFGCVDEVAHAVSFLAAKESGFITGETIYVSGGRYG